MSQSLRPSRDDKTKVETVLVDEILSDPGRSQRPDHIVVIVRGLPGAGKSYLCKLLKVNIAYVCVCVCVCLLNK